MIDGSPQMVSSAFDLHEHLVWMPLSIRKGSQLLNSLPYYERKGLMWVICRSYVYQPIRSTRFL